MLDPSPNSFVFLYDAPVSVTRFMNETHGRFLYFFEMRKKNSRHLNFILSKTFIHINKLDILLIFISLICFYCIIIIIGFQFSQCNNISGRVYDSLILVEYRPNFHKARIMARFKVLIKK